MKLGLSQTLVNSIKPIFVSGPSFANQYSMDFDGVNDRIDCGDFDSSALTALSISVWVKTDFTTGGDTTNIGYIVTKDNVSAGRDLYLTYRGTGHNKLNFGFWSPGGTVSSVSSPTFPLGTPADGNWHLILATWDGTTDANKMQLFVDGSLVAQATANDTGIRDSPTTELTIGGPDATTNTRLFYGNIDEVAIFNGDVSANVADIYNLGTPTDLTSLNPLKWYRMGDNATFKDPQWLLPSNENKDKTSNYSLDFDGVNDYFEIPKNSSLSLINTNFSISIWLNPDFSHNGLLMMNYAGTNGWGVYYNSGSIRFYDAPVWTTVTTISTGQWTHILIVGDYTGSNLICYKNDVEVYNNSHTFTITESTANVFIGSERGTGFFYNGKLDEVSLWNKGLSASEVSELYNNGIPSNLASHSSYSNAISWWRMGDNATFDGTNWTIPDLVGSNSGTTSNMDINSRVGDAPSSENNAISVNMDIADRVQDVPT